MKTVFFWSFVTVILFNMGYQIIKSEIDYRREKKRCEEKNHEPHD